LTFVDPLLALPPRLTALRLDLIRQRSGVQQRSTATLPPASVAVTVRQRSAKPHLTASGSHAAPSQAGAPPRTPGLSSEMTTQSLTVGLEKRR